MENPTTHQLRAFMDALLNYTNISEECESPCGARNSPGAVTHLAAVLPHGVPQRPTYAKLLAGASLWYGHERGGLLRIQDMADYLQVVAAQLRLAADAALAQIPEDK
jgi:hypothetical protein